MESSKTNTWIFSEDDVLNVPSVEKSGWSLHEEAWCRHRACQFIERVGSRSSDAYLTTRRLGGLELHRDLLNKAKIFFHRFYMLNSFKECEYHEVCGALLFLVSKIGRSSSDARLLSDVVRRVAHSAKKKPCDGKELRSWLKRVAYWEIEILSKLCFDLKADLPHYTIAEFLKKFEAEDRVKNVIYLHLDDSLHTTLPVRYTADTIAYTALYLTLKNKENSIKNLPEDWWAILGLKQELLEELAEEIKCARNEHETKRLVKTKYSKTPDTGS